MTSPNTYSEPLIGNQATIQNEEGINSFAQEDNASPEEPNVAEIEFIDLNLEPIVGLKYRLEYDGEHISGQTAATGRTKPLIDVPPGTMVSVLVYREHTKDYKNIGVICVTGGECGYSMVSPKLKFAIETEPHEGAPGTAEENKPLIPPILSEVAPPAVQSSPLPAKAVSLPPASPPKAGSSVPAKQTTTMQAGRDKNGHPMVTVKPSLVDSFFKAVNPMYHIWSWWSERRTQPAPAAKQETKSAAGNPKKGIKQETKPSSMPVTQYAPQQEINPKVNFEQAKGQALSVQNKQYLDKLIQYAEAQIEIDYSAYKEKTAVTQSILKDINSHPPKSSPAKKADKSVHMCFTYVRVALHQNRFVNADAGNGHAKLAGIDLSKENYQNVTTSLPQVEIYYPSGHTKSQHAKVESIQRQQAAIKAQAKKEKWKKNKTDEALKQVEEMPEPDGVSYNQADIMHTLPGDIIVYEQVVPHDPNAAGHIDIRTYHGFVSDFAWPLNVPKLGGKKFDGKQYRVIGVYRKVSDEMAMVRVKAFLKVIKGRETHGYTENDAWYAVYSPTAKKLKAESIATHPSNENENKPAGAYQIIFSSWRKITQTFMGWPATFYPQDQVRTALYILQSLTDKGNKYRTALGYIMEGNIENALTKTKLTGQWSSMPGGTETRGYTMEQLKADYETHLNELS